MRKNYNNDIYRMYEKEVSKNEIANKEIKGLKLEIYVLKSNLKISENNINDATKSLEKEIDKLKYDLSKAYKEIERLKNELYNKEIVNNDYLIDKLNNQLNKDSTNSSIPTSKEIRHKNRTNTYSHRKITGKKWWTN